MILEDEKSIECPVVSNEIDLPSSSLRAIPTGVSVSGRHKGKKWKERKMKDLGNDRRTTTTASTLLLLRSTRIEKS